MRRCRALEKLRRSHAAHTPPSFPRSGGDGKKKIGVWGMVVVGFFWVHGGIYGNEAMLMAGPPLYVFIMLGIVPFVYSLPIALIVAELSTAFPEDGGYVVWVQEACGKVVGSHHAYWVWVIYVVDAAIYPVLVSNYVDTMVPMGETNKGLLSVGIVLAVTAINLLGTDVMVRFNTLLAIMSLLPTIVFTVYGLPEVKPSRCWVDQGEVDWSLLVSWILWLYCGFFSLGTMAGELEDPRRTFIISIAILFPAVLILNTLPLAVALGLDDRAEHYNAGYFNVLAGRLAGAWLDWGFQVGANVCLVGLYNAAVHKAPPSNLPLFPLPFAQPSHAVRTLQVITAERSLFFLVNLHYAPQIAALDEKWSQRSGTFAPLLRWLLSTSHTGVAPAYILINAAAAAVLVWMPCAASPPARRPAVARASPAAADTAGLARLPADTAGVARLPAAQVHDPRRVLDAAVGAVGLSLHVVVRRAPRAAARRAAPLPHPRRAVRRDRGDGDPGGDLDFVRRDHPNGVGDRRRRHRRRDEDRGPAAHLPGVLHGARHPRRVCGARRRAVLCAARAGRREGGRRRAGGGDGSGARQPGPARRRRGQRAAQRRRQHAVRRLPRGRAHVHGAEAKVRLRLAAAGDILAGGLVVPPFPARQRVQPRRTNGRVACVFERVIETMHLAWIASRPMRSLLKVDESVLAVRRRVLISLLLAHESDPAFERRAAVRRRAGAGRRHPRRHPRRCGRRRPRR